MPEIINDIIGFIQGSLLLFGALALLVVGYFMFRTRYKKPDAGYALVVTGGKGGLKIYPGSGAYVSPFRKSQFFSLKTMTVRSDDQEAHTSTLVPIIVKWTAQLRADTSTADALENAVQGFAGLAEQDIEHSLKQTLDGEVRAVIAKMTPEEVVRDKDGFSTQVTEGVSARMKELGFQLVSLNIADVSDRNNYYLNASAKDREDRRKQAETTTADANREVAVARASADEQSRAAEQKRDLAVAEQQQELRLRRAAIQAETDVAEADAAIAGQLQTELRNQELETRRGQVAVVRANQDQASAAARRDVELTEAETARQRLVVEATAAKEQAEIQAAARARQSEIDAEARANVAKRQATGEAEAAVARAQGEAEALTRTAEADAEMTRKTGLAAAEVARAQGEAEASAIRARGEAEAEVQRLMAEALAANDGANLRVTLAEIQRDTTVKVYTAVGEAMARIGEHATFIDMGGSGAKDGDLLSSVLGNVPELLARLNVKSEALNGAPFGAALGSVLSGLTGSKSSSPLTLAEGAGVMTPDSDESSSDDSDEGITDHVDPGPSTVELEESIEHSAETDDSEVIS